MAKELEFGYKKGYSSQVFFIWLWQLLISRVTPQFDGIFVEFENPRGNHIQNNSAQTCSELRVETFSSSIKLHRQKKFHSFFNRIFLARFLLCGFFRLLRSQEWLTGWMLTSKIYPKLTSCTEVLKIIQYLAFIRYIQSSLSN